jgi:ribosomal protein L24
MGMMKFCRIKKDDRVIVLTGDFKGEVGIITSVIRHEDVEHRFFVTLDSLPKKRLKKKKSKDYVKKDVLIDSSNVRLLKNKIES